MKLAIIGAGSVGGTLGTAWAQKAGHDIFFGVNNPKSEKTQALLRTLGGKARAGTAAEAAGLRRDHRLGDAVECRGSGDPRHGRLERPDRA